MTNEKFIKLKADFIKTYKDELCEESMVDIKNAHDIDAFLDILIKYVIHINHRPFPTIEWARKWFADEIEIINEHGIYLDQVVALSNPEKRVMVFFGRCYISYLATNPKIHELSLRDNSTINVVAFGMSRTFIRTRGEENKVNVISRESTAQVRVRNL